MKQATRILMAGHEVVDGHDLRALMQRLGYDLVGSLRSTDEVVREAAEKQPDVLLMVVRPENVQHDVETAVAIRARCGIPIVYVTDYLNEQVLNLARRTKDLGYVVRPVKEEALRFAIEMALHSERIEKQWEETERRYREACSACEETLTRQSAELARANQLLRNEAESHQKTVEVLDNHRVRLALLDQEVQRVSGALEQSREELADLYDKSTVGYATLDGQQRIRSANLTACAILAVDRNHLLGKPLSGFTATEREAVTLERHCHAVLALGMPQSCEIMMKRSDGTHFHAVLESMVVKDVEHDVFLCRTAISDISDRMEAQEARRQWAQVFQHAGWGVAISDPEARTFTIMNPAFARMHGYAVHELTGRPVTDVVAEEKRGELEDRVRRALSCGHHTFECQDLRKDGSTFPVLVDVTIVRDETGVVLYHIANVQDISELKRVEQELRGSEARFRALFESAKDCLFVKDRSLRYTHVNPAAESLLGRNASEIIGRSAADIFGKQAARHVKQFDLRVLEGQSIDHVHALPVNGVLLTFHDVMVPLRDSEGTVTGICSISRNITDLKSLAPVASSLRRHYPSKAMSEALDQARFAASTDATILLLGESGTGKDYMARWIHEHSRRAAGEFFSINCAALPNELAESELFGHEAGAFTGALRRKRGLLELAEGGTLLLNEIGELSLPLQSKLLTFLDTRSFVRVGGETNIHVNARLIAATHRDLKAYVDDGRFLQPLFFRLNVFSLEIPPLRQRVEDIPLIVQEMLAELAGEMQLTYVEPVPEAVLDRLCRYHWPGNVRELRNVLERALMISGVGVFDHDIPLPHNDCHDWQCSLSFSPGRTLYDMRDELTEALCAEALRRSQGNRTEAARLLGISRHSLYRFMKETERVGRKPTDPDE